MIFKNTKITFLIYSPYECTAVEEYLENMAENGWLLTKITGPFFKFKKIEPQKIKYSVDVIDKIASFNSTKANESLEYREYCRAAGWNFIYKTREIQVFYSTENTKIVSIHTDETEKFNLVFKSSLLGRLSELFLTLLLIFNVYTQLSFSGTAYALSSNSSIFIILTAIILILINIIKLFNFSAWAIKAKWKLKKDGFMPYNTYKILRIKNTLINTFSLLSILIILLFVIWDNSKDQKLTLPIFIIVTAFILINPFIKDFISIKGYSKNARILLNTANIFVFVFLLLSLTTSIIFSNITDDKNYSSTACNLNLNIEDFISKETVDKSPYIDCSKSILATKTEYSCGSKDKHLAYTLLQSKYPLVIKFLENRLINGRNLVKININLPKNITVYSSSKNKNFVLVSENKVVDTRNTFENISDDDFLNTIYSKLFFN